MLPVLQSIQHLFHSRQILTRFFDKQFYLNRCQRGYLGFCRLAWRSFLLANGIGPSAFGLGALLALLAHNALWLDTTVQAQLALGLTDASQRFNYFGVSERLLIICGAVLASGLLGMLIPLARNVRRNPIRDMRDE